MTKSRTSSTSSTIFGACPDPKKVSMDEIMRLFAREVLPVQRDHQKRAPKTKYLHGTLFGDQLIFHAVYIQELRSWALLDGYTRCECYFRGWAKVLDKVLLVQHRVQKLEDSFALYDQVNNPRASKKAPDRLDEGLRFTQLKDVLMSRLVLGAGTATAVMSASGAENPRDGVIALKEGVAFVDALGLAQVHETAGVKAAYFAIAQHASQHADVAEEFIRKMNQAIFGPRKNNKADEAINQYRKFFFDKKKARTCGGGKHVEDIMRFGLGAFTAYLAVRKPRCGIPSRLSQTLTLTEFTQAMAKTKRAA